MRAAAVALTICLALAVAGCATDGKEPGMDADEALAELVVAVGSVVSEPGWAQPVPPSPLSCTLGDLGGHEWEDDWEGTAVPDDIEKVSDTFLSRGFAVRVRVTGTLLTEVLASSRSGLRIAFGLRPDGSAFVNARSACFKRDRG